MATAFLATTLYGLQMVELGSLGDPEYLPLLATTLYGLQMVELGSLGDPEYLPHD